MTELLPRELNLNTLINVFNLIQARHLEIKEMEAAISSVKGQKRVFQLVPRHMRRRAASYNVKRLPVRFRSRATEQMLRDPSQQLVRRKRRKPTRLLAERLAKWLPTHIWHAKRMKMVSLWGLSIPARRTQRSFRFVSRATRNDCVIHDGSYNHILEINGSVLFINLVD